VVVRVDVVVGVGARSFGSISSLVTGVPTVSRDTT
jgi:hypothetical protein